MPLSKRAIFKAWYRATYNDCIVELVVKKVKGPSDGSDVEYMPPVLFIPGPTNIAYNLFNYLSTSLSRTK